MGWLIPKQGPNPSKPPKITPKIAFFDPNFTFRFPKSHKNPGMDGWVNSFGKTFPKKKRFYFWGAPLIHPLDGLMMFLPGSFGFSTARLVGLGKDAIFSDDGGDRQQREYTGCNFFGITNTGVLYIVVCLNKAPI